MNSYHIQPCTLRDLQRMNAAMRPIERSEIEGFGSADQGHNEAHRSWTKVRHALFHLWRESIDPRAAYIEDEGVWKIAAVWGDEGGMLEPVGRAWLFTAPIIEKLPLAFFKETRREIEERLKVRKILRSSVRADYPQALRFFRLLGFWVSEKIAIPPYGVEYHVIEITRKVEGGEKMKEAA